MAELGFNLGTSISNPLTFYTVNESNDWISNKSYKNDHLWNNPDDSKGIYDPCPDGWRVPESGSNDLALWNGATGLHSSFETGYGMHFNTNSYFPASGYRSSASGELTKVGTRGTQWSRSPFHTTSYSMYFESYYTQTVETSTNRASALSVRCVKEH